MPPIHLAIRRGAEVSWRYEHEWPLARTNWTVMSLDAGSHTLQRNAPKDEAKTTYSADPDASLGGSVSSYDEVLTYDGTLSGDGKSVLFLTEPLPADTEITGPLALTLALSCTEPDTDIFVTVRNLAPDGSEIVVDGLDNPQTPVTQGWLRLSHRQLDTVRSTPFRPIHRHQELLPVTPSEIVEVQIELGPTSMVFEKGHRLAVEIGSHDLKGSFPILHNDPADRKVGGTVTIHTGPTHRSSLLLPLIPSANPEGSQP